ncbi:hypothetical protein V2J09_000472 [Rumex salicifolius]
MVANFKEEKNKELREKENMKRFSVQVESAKEGQGGRPTVGPVYRNPISEHGFPPPDPQISTVWDSFRLSVEKYPDNKMLGWRELVNGNVWKTYKQAYDEVLSIGSALRECGAEPGARVGIYGANCPQWVAAMEVLSPDCLSSIRLQTMVCLTTFEEDDKSKVENAGIRAFSWTDFVKMGKQHFVEPAAPQSFHICTIMYTSGTSGEPKGVVITHENATLIIRGLDIFMDTFEDKMTVNDVYLSFLPLAHILDRAIEEYFFRKGASVGYYHGNINEIRDDLQELKPTFFAGVPRGFKRPLKNLIQGEGKLAWMNMGFKQKNASPLADLIAFRKVKDKLGGCLRLIVSGAAPLSREIEEFLRVTCCCFVLQGYEYTLGFVYKGLTETCGLVTYGHPDEMCMLGTVGCVSVYTEFRLEEVPEMGYHPLDEPPRGEICVRGKTVFSEYYKNPELTKDVFRDGWFHTGDIGEMLPNGIVKIIDRKKNLIKLSQGEYVALEYLEKIYGVCSIVEDIWVYGDSFKAMLVAVVVPNGDYTEKWANQNGHNGSHVDLCSLEELNSHVLTELRSASDHSKLRGFECIKGVILEPKLFETQTGLVTPTMKKRRNAMLKHYQKQIDQLYQALAKGSINGALLS